MILKPSDIRYRSHVVVLGGIRRMDDGRKVLKKVAIDAQQTSDIAEYISGRYNDTNYYILGIFPNLSPTTRTRLSWDERRAIHTKKDHDLLGSPEGYEISRTYSGKGISISKNSYNACRTNYQNKLKGIMEKAKELMVLGIDPKTAIAAARKCGCHT